MLPLRNRYSFKAGIPQTVIQNPFFVFRYQSNTLGHSRFTVVVSKKIDAHAVGRNRIKRIFSEALLRIIKEQNTSIDGVFYVRRAAAQLTVERAYQEIQTLLQKHAIIHI